MCGCAEPLVRLLQGLTKINSQKSPGPFQSALALVSNLLSKTGREDLLGLPPRAPSPSPSSLPEVCPSSAFCSDSCPHHVPSRPMYSATCRVIGHWLCLAQCHVRYHARHFVLCWCPCECPPSLRSRPLSLSVLLLCIHASLSTLALCILPPPSVIYVTPSVIHVPPSVIHVPPSVIGVPPSRHLCSIFRHLCPSVRHSRTSLRHLSPSVSHVPPSFPPSLAPSLRHYIPALLAPLPPPSLLPAQPSLRVLEQIALRSCLSASALGRGKVEIVPGQDRSQEGEIMVARVFVLARVCVWGGGG